MRLDTIQSEICLSPAYYSETHTVPLCKEPRVWPGLACHELLHLYARDDPSFEQALEYQSRFYISTKTDRAEIGQMQKVRPESTSGTIEAFLPYI